MAIPSSDENGGNKKSEYDSEGKAIRRPHKRVIVFLYTILFIVGTIAIGIGIAYWQQQSYRGNWFALGWGILGCMLLVVGGGVCFYASVVEPSKHKPLEPPADRPWLSVDVIPAGPITFEEDGATIPIIYRITNRGHSPTDKIRMKAALFFPRFGDNPIDRQKKICQSSWLPFISGVVFPGTPAEFGVTDHADIKQMREFATEEMKKNSPNGEVDWTDPYIGGCLTYTFGQPGALFTGETGFLYQVQVVPVDNPRITKMLKIGEDVPVDRLVFSKYLMGGDYAK